MRINEFHAVLRRMGFERSGMGSRNEVVLRRENATIKLPNHSRDEVSRNYIADALAHGGIPVEEFLRYI